MNKSKMKISKFVKMLKREVKNVNIRGDLTFKDLTTFKIGGKIKCLVEITDVSTLMKVLHFAKQFNINYFILGQGSNVLASDKIFKTLVIKICLKGIVCRKNKIICSAGENLFKLNHFAINNGLSGLEWSYGIPGSVGGAVKMNAGSFGGEIKDVVESVYYTDGNKIYKKTNKSLMFGYRKSFFTNNNYVILKVVFCLKDGCKHNIENKCFENYKKRQKLQPYNLPSAGSVFKRPLNEFAPVLIEKCQLKGLKQGGAVISPKHCGFIVNDNGKATFKNVFKLICKIKKTVLKKFDIILEEEIIILR